MAETNGTGRLDRIEAVLDKLAEGQRDLQRRQEEFQIVQEHDHERFTREAQQLLTWQVLMQEKMDRYSADRDAERKRLDALSEKTDERVASLVRAIGELIHSRHSESN